MPPSRKHWVTSRPWAEVSAAKDQRVAVHFVTDLPNKPIIMSARYARHLALALRLAARNAEKGENCIFAVGESR